PGKERAAGPRIWRPTSHRARRPQQGAFGSPSARLRCASARAWSALTNARARRKVTMSWFAKSALLLSCLVACAAPDAPPSAPTPAPTDDPAHVPFAGRFTPDGHYLLDASVPLAYRRNVTLRAQKGDQYDN